MVAGESSRRPCGTKREHATLSTSPPPLPAKSESDPIDHIPKGGSSMTAIRPKPKAMIEPNLSYVDRPEVSEAFADSLEKFVFDGAVLRMEFTVIRYDDPKPSVSPSGRKITSCRLVLPPNGIVQLMNRLEQLKQHLISTGVMTAAGAPVKGPPTPIH
jgi:hypothetical protein